MLLSQTRYQPVEVLRNLNYTSSTVSGNLNNAEMNNLYLHLKQGDFSWIEPLNMTLVEDEPFVKTVTITPETKFETVDISTSFQ